MPPVPADITKASTAPAVCRHTSGPIPAACARMFAKLSNWLQKIEPAPSSAARRRATLTALRGSAIGAGGTSSTSAPSASISRRFSSETSSVTTSKQRYPHARASSARLTPVEPDVASTSVPPGRSAPDASASATIAAATRSLLLPPGLRNSHLPRISQPVASLSERSRTSGVPPMRSRKSAATPRRYLRRSRTAATTAAAAEAASKALDIAISPLRVRELGSLCVSV